MRYHRAQSDKSGPGSQTAAAGGLGALEQGCEKRARALAGVSAFWKTRKSGSNPGFHAILTDTQSLRDALAHRFPVDSDLGTDQGRRIALGELAETEQCCQKMCETTLVMLRKALALNGAHHKFINYAIAWIDPGVADQA